MNQETIGGSIQPKQKSFSSNIFTVVVSDRSFQVSWKSLISDGPENFFTRNYIKSKSRVIHVDRNPDTFELIIRHLRGYPVVAKNECQHQDLLNDAQFYGLKKLFKVLKQFVYINVGGSTFRLKWSLFDKDGPHNYFTGPLKHSLLSPHPSLGESFPITIQRDPVTFKDIVRHLQGYSISIKDEEHRLKLLSDAEFYSLKKLRDKLCTATTDEHVDSEILVYLQDIRPSSIRISEKNGDIYYIHENKLFRLMVQINDMNGSYHINNGNEIFLLEEQDIKIRKDPQWLVSNQLEWDKDCAVVVQATKSDPETYLRLNEYTESLKKEKNHWKTCKIHDQCSFILFGIEKAISSMSIYPESISKLKMSVKKAQVVRSRKQANLKRNFLTH